ncbi:MAG: glycine cleavage system aminomethyltransferase GcvT [Nitrospirota bacterium]|nr:glycine cleavage system aminomethyltransferase GcvT [Nitrospirota bacterium]
MKQSIVTPVHTRSSAVMTDFQGWRVPAQYGDPAEEYHAVRNNSGLFDVCHLGRLEVSGPDALQVLQPHFTRNIGILDEGSALFGLLCNDQGGILDAVLLFRLFSESADPRFLVTTSPAAFDRVRKQLSSRAYDRTRITDTTESTAQFALQGPGSDAVLEAASGSSFKRLKRKKLKKCEINGVPVLVSRTGFTGERGFELFLPADKAADIWTSLLSGGKAHGMLPCGMTCREMLRIEAGYCLSGSELDGTRNPAEAGLMAFVDLNAGFLARDAVAAFKTSPPAYRLMGFEVFDKGIPRQGATIFSEVKEVGIVTSGIHSISRRKDIGMGYALERYSQPGQEIEVEIKDREVAARILAMPFYRKK